MKLWSVWIIVGLASAGATAGSYEPRHVPADARWVAHVDVTAAVNSQLAQLILADFKPLGVEEKLSALGVLTGIDPLNGVLDATLYGKTFDEQGAVLIVRLRGDTSKLLALAQLNENYAATTYDDMTIHSWTEPGHHGNRVQRHAGVYTKPGDDVTTIVSAMDMKMVEKQLDLLHGEGASVAEGPGKLAVPDEAGVFVFGSVTGLTELSGLTHGMHSDMLRAAESVTVAVAEREGQMSASVKVTAATQDQATSIQQLALGAVAIARLTMPQDIDPQIRNLINRVVIQQANRTVTANISYASAELHDIIRKGYAEEMQRIQQAGPIDASPTPPQEPAEATAPSDSADPAQP